MNMNRKVNKTVSYKFLNVQKKKMKKTTSFARQNMLYKLVLGHLTYSATLKDSILMMSSNLWIKKIKLREPQSRQ